MGTVFSGAGLLAVVALAGIGAAARCSKGLFLREHNARVADHQTDHSQCDCEPREAFWSGNIHTRFMVHTLTKFINVLCRL